MSDSNRLKTYAALAAAPCAALGGIAVEAHAAPGQVPATAQLNNNSWNSANAFTAADIQFQAFAFFRPFQVAAAGFRLKVTTGERLAT